MSAADVIQAAMKKRGLRQADLVPIIGHRGRTLEVVNGKRAVPRPVAAALARKLRVPLKDIIETRER